jgi:hypothetical protein
MRASVSVGPPAGNGTIMVIGCDGKVSAFATGKDPSVATSATAIEAALAVERNAANVMCFPWYSQP